MTRFVNAVAGFATNPANILGLLFLWVGVALLGTDSTLETKALLLTLMALPAALGYMIGRRGK